MRTYEFKIREVLERTVRVDAESRGEAENCVNNLYRNENIVLDAEDLVEDDRDRIIYVGDYSVINTDDGIQHFVRNDKDVVDKFND